MFLVDITDLKFRLAHCLLKHDVPGKYQIKVYLKNYLQAKLRVQGLILGFN